MAKISAHSNREANHSPDALKVALDNFEASLLTPMISGELVVWLEAVRQLWEEVSAQVHFQVKHLHPRQYEEMAEQDSELLPRIEQLRAEDASVEEHRAQLSQSIGRSAQHVPKMEPDEEKALEHIRFIVELGTAFLTRVRKQQIAVQTWYVEAFNRDHGAVD